MFHLDRATQQRVKEIILTIPSNHTFSEIFRYIANFAIMKTEVN